MLVTPADVAETQIGVKEATGNNDGVPAERYNRGDKVAWCGSFVTYCYEKSDFPRLYETDSMYYLMRNVANFEREMQKRGAWFGWRFASIVNVNDIVFYGDRQQSDAGNGRHVGLVVDVGIDEQGLFIETIEGNYGNKVAKRTLRANDKAITGYGRWQPGSTA